MPRLFQYHPPGQLALPIMRFGVGTRVEQNPQPQGTHDPMAIRIVVPGIPPSVNSYVRHTRAGTHYKTAEAEFWAELLGFHAREHFGKNLEAEYVSISIHLGKGQKLDIDNGPKVILDSLVRGRIIRSDATIKHLELWKSRVKEGERGYTEIEIL